MRPLTEPDEWNIVQEGFDPADNRVYESLFSLGNGHFGGRGNHEEAYSGDSLPGNYLAGIYYPDPTRVGWWKNGYPEYFAKVLNAADWKPLHITVDGEPLDLATAQILSFRRVLHMRTGELTRTFRATLPNGVSVDVDTTRFVSLVRKHVGAIRYRITPLDAEVAIGISAQVDGDVVNEDSNYDEGFWDEVSRSVDGSSRCGGLAHEEDRIRRGHRNGVRGAPRRRVAGAETRSRGARAIHRCRCARCRPAPGRPSRSPSSARTSRRKTSQ